METQDNNTNAAPVVGSGHDIKNLLTPDVAEHLRVLARRFVFNERLPEDLEGDIEHDLVTAVGKVVGRFDPGIATFSTFASRIAERKLVDMHRRLVRAPAIVASLQDEVGYDEDANVPILLGDAIADESDERERRELCLSVREAVGMMQGTERDVCERIMRGETMRDIRQALNIRKWSFYATVIPSIARQLKKFLALDRTHDSAETKERDVGGKACR